LTEIYEVRKYTVWANCGYFFVEVSGTYGKFIVLT